MKSFRPIPIKKVILIVSLSIVSILLVLCLMSYLIIHNYINKINLVSPESISNCMDNMDNAEAYSIENSNTDAFSIVGSNTDFSIIEDSDTDDSSIEDSPREEIDLVEENLRINMEENQTPIMDEKDVINILLIGSDTRKSGGSGRSDAMIIVSINKKTKTITATSILRDIYIQIPGKGNNRLNAAYAFGGADLLMQTIEMNFKIRLSRYASVDFYAFIDVIDELGGITLDVSDKEIPIINSYVTEINRLTKEEETKDQLTEPGLLLLNGKQALGYARNRYVGNSDFERTARQRRVLEQVFIRVKDLKLLELNDLLNVILPQVTTNLTEGEIFSLILGLPSYANYDLQQCRIPIDGSYKNMRVKRMSVLSIDYEKNINEIQDKIYGMEE